MRIADELAADVVQELLASQCFQFFQDRLVDRTAATPRGGTADGRQCPLRAAISGRSSPTQAPPARIASIASSNLAGSIGLVRQVSMPASRHRCDTSGVMSAVRAMIGTCGCPRDVNRNSLVASSPFMDRHVDVHQDGIEAGPIASASSASSPLFHDHRRMAGALQHLADDPLVGPIVVGHQDMQDTRGLSRRLLRFLHGGRDHAAVEAGDHQGREYLLLVQGRLQDRR